MPIHLDVVKGKMLAERLYHLFSTTGIHGKIIMPEDILPAGVQRGSLEHLLFLTLTVAIDYQRDANKLWKVSRSSFEDTRTRYLYDPKSLSSEPFQKIVADMQQRGLSQKPTQDAKIWRTVGVTFFKKWDGDPRKFLADCAWDAEEILTRLRTDSHLFGQRHLPDYPFLRGDKIGPLWLRILRDNVGIQRLRNLEHVPIPVDIHIARSTLSTGIVRGEYAGKLTDLFDHIRKAWFESVKGLRVKGRPMIALDVDEPLWHLSKYGCKKRDSISGKCPAYPTCEVSDSCVEGKVIIEKGRVEIQT